MTIVQFIEKWRANARIFSAGNDCSATAGEAITELLDELDTLQAERPTTPVEDARAGLISARNTVMGAIVSLRGGHAATTDACDEAMAGLDIAIGKLSTLLTEAERPTVEPAEMSIRQAALLDSQFRAGAKAGWNAAQLDDPDEADAAIARLIRVNAGDMAVFKAERPTTPVEDDWALARVRRMAETARTNAGVYGAKLLKGHGYPDEVMRDAQDALALEEILARLAPTVEAERPTVEQLTTGFVWITCPDCGERCQLGTMHHCRYRGAVQVPPRK
jgi:hypothetical protein